METARQAGLRCWLYRVAVVLILCVPVEGQQSSSPPPAAEEDLSVEEILGLQVTSVGRKAQQVANAPAAVYVITQEDIRRSGAVSIPDILRIVPGLVVARINGNTWAISARGGTRQFANSMQVMIDGRPVYNRLFSGVFWDTQDMVLEDIDRIEVIRGTGAVMWGSNAVNGVIHIISKSAKDTQGSLLRLGSGNEDVGGTSYRFGGKLGEKAFYRVWGKQQYRQFYADGSGLIRRNLVEAEGVARTVNEGFADDQDGSAVRVGFRLDWEKSTRDLIQVSGIIYRNGMSMENWVLDSNAISRRLRVEELAPGGNVLARWLRTGSSNSETAVQFWSDRKTRNSQLYRIRLDSADVEIQHRRQFGESHELHLGAGTRLTTDSLRGRSSFQFGETSRTDWLSNVMLRDEVQLFARRLTLSVGVRAEHNAYTGFEWQPSLRAIWNQSKAQSLWASWSRAVRTPSRAEHDASAIPLGQSRFGEIPVLIEFQGNRRFAAERLEEWAAGYRFQRRQRWSMDVSLFHNHYKRMASLELGELDVQLSPQPRLTQSVFTGNGREGINQGFEVAGSGSIRPWWKLHGSYSFLQQSSEARQGSLDPVRHITGEEPRHQLKLRSMWNLSRRWQVDFSGYGVDRIPAMEVAGRVRMDVRLGFQPSRRQDFSIAVQDLLDQRRLEFQSELFGYAVAMRRTWVARWTVRF